MILKGDAFFEIARDAHRPFIIRTQEVQVEVLGTAFYVDSRQDQAEVKVVVESGRVALSHQDDVIQLTIGEVGIFDKKTGELQKVVNKDKNYLSWKTNTFHFEEVDLSEVVNVLNQHYKSHISIESPVLNKCPIDAVFTDKSLDAIIRIMEKTFGIQSKRTGDQIILFGTGCD